MKHNLTVTLILLLLFFLAQVIGLIVISKYVSTTTIEYEGKEIQIEVVKELPYSERPEIKKETSYIPILIMVAIGSVLAFILTRFQLKHIWGIWFFLAVWFCITAAFHAFFSKEISALIGLVLTSLKVFRRTAIFHNLSELFIYAGLAAFFVPILNVTSMIIILLLISVYDFIAVFKTKHMIKMAKFQAKTKLFAGLLIPYRYKKEWKSAILGGGDIAFPLLFAGVLFSKYGWNALAVSVLSCLALFVLFMISKKDKFYPAMPFISAGCLIGYGLLVLL